MKVNFIKSKERRKILDQLNEAFGVKEMPYLLIEAGKEKIRGFSGNITKEEITELSEIARVEIIGLYLFRKEGKEDGNKELRLGLDGSHIFSKEIDKNVVEISDEELQKWLRGNDLEKKEDYGMKVVMNKGDFFGCTKSTGEKLVNFMPKERRIRN